MKALLGKLLDGVREDFGQPVGLQRLILDEPEIRVPLETPAASISAESVVRWHELDAVLYPRHSCRRRGTLLGWRHYGGYYSSYSIHRPEYEEIGHCKVIEHWACDITEVDGLSASKSVLRDFKSTDQMVEANSANMIDEITYEKLAENLAHREIRIIHSPGSDHFCRYLWDGRVFLANSGGSHHFAAAKYIASRLPEPVTLHGKLNTYELNVSAIGSLRADFEMFVISDEPTISTRFHDAMTSFRATWLWHHLPCPFDRAKAILLPRNEARSMRVASVLREAGVADLGRHLMDLAAIQARS